MIERVRAVVVPVLADLGLDLYDLEHHRGVLRVTVDRAGGVDLDTLTLATRLLSRALDDADPVPGRYTLEVTSPGLERPLRTPHHFQRAVGAEVSVRTHPEVAGPRRAVGVLVEADEHGCTIEVREGPDAGRRRLAYTDIERARTVFTWGPAPKPAGRGTARPSTKKAGAS